MNLYLQLLNSNLNDTKKRHWQVIIPYRTLDLNCMKGMESIFH